MANMKYYGEFLGTKEVAKRFKVTECTVVNWVRRGWIPYTDLSYGLERPIYGFKVDDVLMFDPKNFRAKAGRKKSVKPYETYFEYDEEKGEEKMEVLCFTNVQSAEINNAKRNPKRAQSYWGFNVYFKDLEMMDRFLKLYEDLFLDSYTMELEWSTNEYRWDPRKILHIIVEKGTIPMIKDALGDLMKCYHRRYYIGCEPKY